LTATHNSELKSEAYEININSKEIKIIYGEYSGYVYAL
jgi:N-acetyl-beta-hexosaminidase